MASRLVERLTNGIELYDPSLRDRLAVSEQLGCLMMPLELSADSAAEQSRVAVVGFAPLESTIPRMRVFAPRTELHELQAHEQNTDVAGKGIGLPRLYVSPQAAAGWLARPDTVGMFSMVIDPARMVDMRQPDDITLTGAAARIQTHYGVKQSAKQPGGMRHRLQAIHAAYDAAVDDPQGAQTVRYNQPPRAAIRQMLRGAGAGALPAGFFLPRDPSLQIRHEGSGGAAGGRGVLAALDTALWR